MNAIKRESHYVPQFYLRNWSLDGRSVEAYPLLAPTEKEARWKPRSIKSLARLTDFYTSVASGQDSDEVENWLAETFEDPAAPVLKKIANDQQLTTAEWEVLIRFAGMQAGRTVKSYLDMRDRAARFAEQHLDDSLQRAVRKVERLARKGKSVVHTEHQSSVPLVTVSPEISPDGKAFLRATFISGREYFLWYLHERLPRLLPVLLRHQWSIIRPHPGTEWFTSDHPFVALNYTRPDKYDLKGGWGRKKGNLLFPLSPRHLLFAEVGRYDIPHYFTATCEKTFELQKMIAENAHRWLYARTPLKRALFFRQSYINRSAFQAEIREIHEWHRTQTDALKVE